MTIDPTLLYVILLIALAAACSGLNISLMSLNLADLRRKAKLGNSRAKRVLPFRENAHLSLASILLVNAGAASATPLVINTKLNGIVAGIISTLLLVVFAELAPQAFFTKHALPLCSYFSPLLRLMVVLTYPISKPLQLTFDNIVGRQEDQILHSRRELGLLISDHLGETESELDEDEVEIIRGALQLSEKQVSEIMTEIRYVYWLTKDFVIDGRTIDEIKAANWSRIPIFDKSLTKCFGILRMKDMVDIDFDGKSYKVSDLKLLPTKTVGSRTALDTMFRHFIGARTHLMPVEKNGKIAGIITIEDLIEEIIGHEIVDESDHLAHRG
ncbi:MAG TPA: CNNM domain-containing protein [Candidatus Saccharimonadales bacterium]|nr:CNNM domain-containing protein [Candidatus Saccharimonadales bacterium]